jgi:CxxC-x17-CxxC domain-containing protein
MGYVDKTLQCAECGADFTFDASEQEFYASKGFTNEPKRCPACRQSRRQRDSRGGAGGPREMHTAICASCGKEAQVPFEPREGRPVYCSDCYAQSKR